MKKSKAGDGLKSVPGLTSLRIALVFLTTLPVRYPEHATTTDQQRSLLLYPLAGLLIGLVLWLAALILPPHSLVAAGLILAIWVVITGALHLDGLADCVDGLVGGMGDRDKTIRIMKDPAIGAMGAVALVLLLGLKLVAIIEIVRHGMLAGLIVVPMLARLTPVVLFATTRYVREDGIGSRLQRGSGSAGATWICVAVTLVIGLVVLGSGLLWLAVTAVIASWLVRRTSVQRLGGFTGDVAGAMIELVELCCLLTLVLVTAGLD